VHVPASYDPARPLPLVIALHGHGGSPSEFEIASDLSSLSEASGFVVAYPAGVGGAWRAFAGSDDVRFLRELVARLQARASIDRRRVYVTGFSAGGGMAHRAACEAADVFAAAAPASAALSDYRDCAPSRPLSILGIQGAADPVVLPEGGNGSWPAIGEWTRFWAQIDRCEATPTVTALGLVSETAWNRCAGGSEVRSWMVEGLDHSWWVNANADLWQFLERHSLPG
jgi:polyhydroxybutyrate depolymerase